MEAYALLATPTGQVPSINFKAVVEHPARVAHTACRLAQADASGVCVKALALTSLTFFRLLGTPKERLWLPYTPLLVSLFGIVIINSKRDAELHQLASPETAAGFLDGLLELNKGAHSVVSESSLFVGYIGRSWLAIARSKGFLPSVSAQNMSLSRTLIPL